MGRLDELDLSLKLSRKEQDERLEAGYERLTELRLELGGKLGGAELGPPVCVLFEGWDASGKGGAIKRLVAPLDLRHVRVAQFAAPDLRREAPPLPVAVLARCCPGWGGMAVLDRSWYGRVLVERVEGFAERGRVARAPTTRSSRFERSLARRGHGPDQVLDAHLRRGAAAAVRAPRDASRSSAGS